MEINGLKIRDMRDVQDVLMALETLKSGLENISDKFDTNFDNYQYLSDTTNDNITKQSEIISAIGRLQNNIRLLQNNYEENLKKEDQLKNWNATVLEVMLKKFEDDLEKLLNETINNIDSKI